MRGHMLITYSYVDIARILGTFVLQSAYIIVQFEVINSVCRCIES